MDILKGRAGNGPAFRVLTAPTGMARIGTGAICRSRPDAVRMDVCAADAYVAGTMIEGRS